MYLLFTTAYEGGECQIYFHFVKFYSPFSKMNKKAESKFIFVEYGEKIPNFKAVGNNLRSTVYRKKEKKKTAVTY